MYYTIHDSCKITTSKTSITTTTTTSTKLIIENAQIMISSRVADY